MKLWVKAFNVKTEDMTDLTTGHDPDQGVILPGWVLFGVSECNMAVDKDLVHIVVFSEFDLEELMPSVYGKGIQPTAAEREAALRFAAIQAVGLAVDDTNYKDLGERLLAEYPSARVAASEDEMIIIASLKTRDNNEQRKDAEMAQDLAPYSVYKEI